MLTEQRVYRGVQYKSTEHEQASTELVEHVYRGKRYQASLKHEVLPADTQVKLRYRGKVYQHRQSVAS